MAEWTKFKELSDVLAKMGIVLSPIEPLPPIDVIKGEDLDDLVTVASGGVYHVDPTKGTVTRLTFNICDKDIMWIKRDFEKCEQVIQKEEFDNTELIEALHKYHFTYCRTLEDFHKKNQQSRYYGSSRWTGGFLYSYIKDNKVIKKNDKQTLFPCNYCLKNLKRKTGRKYNQRDFDIKDALEVPPPSGDITGQLECEWIPNIYSDDFSAISARLKKEKDYTCEDCKKKAKEYLHCHHINHLKHDNRQINLRVLCRDCHSEYHSHMKK